MDFVTFSKHDDINIDDEELCLCWYDGCNNIKYLPSEIRKIIKKLEAFCNNHTDTEIMAENKIKDLESYKHFFGIGEHKVITQPRNRPGYVYIFECGGKYKVGFSTNVEQRKQQLDTRSFKLSLIYKKFFKNAYKVEQTIHAELCKQGYNIENEWYILDNDDLQWLIDSLENNSEDVLTYVE